MGSLEDLKLPEIKKILRSCEVDPTDILAAKTRYELLELARFNGITTIPDEWTIAKIKQQKQLAKTKAAAEDTLEGRAEAAAQQAEAAKKSGDKGSFFSRRASKQAKATPLLQGSSPDAATTSARPEAGKSAASSVAARRLARAQGREAAKSDRKAPGVGPLHGPGMRTHGELQRQLGFTDDQKSAVIAMRAARDPAPQGEEADEGLVSIAELKELGFTPATLVRVSFDPKLLYEAGYTLQELVGDPSITPSVLKQLEFGPAALTEIGITPAEMRTAGYSPHKLRSEANLSLADLKAAGYTAREFKEKGFSAAEFQQAGFTHSEIKSAGFKAEGLLKKSKWSLADLHDAGFPASEIRLISGCAPEELIQAGYDVEVVKKCGYTKAELGDAPAPAVAVEEAPGGAPAAAERTPPPKAARFGDNGGTTTAGGPGGAKGVGKQAQGGSQGQQQAVPSGGFTPLASSKAAAKTEATASTAAATAAATEAKPQEKPRTRTPTPTNAGPSSEGASPPGVKKVVSLTDMAAIGPIDGSDGEGKKAEGPEEPDLEAAKAFAAKIKGHIMELAQMSPEERATSLLINDVGELLREQGRKKEAEKLFADALELRRSLLGDDDARTLTSLNNLGLLMYEQRRYYESMPLLEEAVATRRRTQGDKHPETLTAINNLAANYRMLKQITEAEPLYAECLEARRSVLGNRHPDTLTSLNNLAQLYIGIGTQDKLELAEPLLKEAHLGAKRELGADHPHALIFGRNLEALHDKRKHQQSLLRRASSAFGTAGKNREKRREDEKEKLYTVGAKNLKK